MAAEAPPPFTNTNHMTIMQKSQPLKTVLLWVLAILLTLAGAIYQRRTGPTHPYRGKVSIGDSELSYRLLRSFPMPHDAPIRVTVEDKSVKGYYRFRRFPSHDQWQERQLEREGDELVAYIPQQPAAGKVQYQIILQKDMETAVLSEDPVVIRFRGSVPAVVLIPHIIAMFLAMMLSTRAGLAALFREKTFKLTLWTFVFLAVGGLILGPIVQKFAFGAYWTGWPSGTDLTDNKTALAVIFWLVALVMTRKNPRHRSWVIVASVALLLIYLIPHSTLGSEIDWTQEDIESAAQTAENPGPGFIRDGAGIN